MFVGSCFVCIAQVFCLSFLVLLALKVPRCVFGQNALLRFYFFEIGFWMSFSARAEHFISIKFI